MTTPYLGSINTYGFQFAPQGWAKCQGQLLAISQNDALFSLLGTTYGGDGVTTFGLPDLQGRAMLEQGTSLGQTYVMGQKAGVESVTLTTTSMPTHSHPLDVTTVAATVTPPAPADLIAAPNGVDANLGAVTVKMYAPTGGAMTPLAPQSIGLSGGNQPFDIQQPFLCINPCIALQGIYPSQN